MEKKLNKILIGLLILTGIITVLFTIIVCYNFTLFEEVNWGVTGQVGDFFGGVVGTLVASIGFILIYLSFVTQTKSQEKQEQQFLKSQIESRFFELIKLHKENVNDIIYKPVGKEELKGRKAIDFIYEQIETCYKEIEVFFQDVDSEIVYEEKYLKKAKIYLTKRSQIDLILLAKLDIAYSIVFFGTSHRDSQTLARLLSKYYKERFTTNIFRYIRLKPLSTSLLEHWHYIQKEGLTVIQIIDVLEKPSDLNITSIKDLLDVDYTYRTAFGELFAIHKLNKYYGGHQYKLGHYFRHLFQTVKYIDEKEILKYREKYDYIKTLRAQLSTIEQYLIYFNSLSFMGRAWELENIVDNITDDNVDKWLITKYNFIKNIPDLYPFEGVLEIDNYYPEVHFEFENEPKARKGLVDIFNTQVNLKKKSLFKGLIMLIYTYIVIP